MLSIKGRLPAGLSARTGRRTNTLAQRSSAPKKQTPHSRGNNVVDTFMHLVLGLPAVLAICGLFVGSRAAPLGIIMTAPAANVSDASGSCSDSPDGSANPFGERSAA